MPQASSFCRRVFRLPKLLRLLVCLSCFSAALFASLLRVRWRRVWAVSTRKTSPITLLGRRSCQPTDQRCNAKINRGLMGSPLCSYLKLSFQVCAAAARSPSDPSAKAYVAAVVRSRSALQERNIIGGDLARFRP